MTRIRFEQPLGDGTVLFTNREVEDFELVINDRRWVVAIHDDVLTVRHGPDGMQDVVLRVSVAE
jgi:hypothetical protein